MFISLNLVCQKTLVGYLIHYQQILMLQLVQIMIKIKYFLIPASLACYLMGRICDDISWYVTGISPEGIEGLSMAGLGAGALLSLAVRIQEEGWAKVVLVQSQLKFIIPWSLIILECVLEFNIFGCYKDDFPEDSASLIVINYPSCVLYALVLLLHNLNYALVCNDRAEAPFYIVFEITLFAEIIYIGTLLMNFINSLSEKPKDYSILYISIMIAWQILVMDLIFRAGYEDREKEERFKQIDERFERLEETSRGEEHDGKKNQQKHKNGKQKNNQKRVTSESAVRLEAQQFANSQEAVGNVDTSK